VLPLLGLLLGCAPPPAAPAAADCGERTVSPGEVRACRMASGETPSGVGAHTTDWRLDNALLTVVVRDGYAPLAALEGAGGTVVTLSPSDGRDVVMELQPTLPGGWFQRVAIHAEPEEGEGAIVLYGVDAGGQAQQLVYRLLADDPVLHLEGATGFDLVPDVGAETVGATMELGGTVLAGLDGSLPAAADTLLDQGGDLGWSGADAVVVGTRRTAYAALWPGGIAVSGTALGSWVEARDAQGQAQARLPVQGGAFTGEVPAGTVGLVATAEGYGEGAAVAPGEDLALSLGEAGSLAVRVADERGADLAAVVERDGRSWFVPAGGTTLPVGPGTAPTRVWAGPSYEAELRSALVVAGETSLDVILPRVGRRDAVVLADLGLEGWPDAQVRETGSDRLARESALGVGYVVVVADDEVAQDLSADGHVTQALRVRGGSRAQTATMGRPLAWPWSASSIAAGQGAAPWPMLDAADLLAVMAQGGARTTVIDAGWLAAAQSATAAEPATTTAASASAFRLDGLADLPAWLGLLDAGVDLPLVGPWTWVEGVDPAAFAAVDVETALIHGQTIASTGPRIVARVGDQGPGSVGEADTGASPTRVALDLRVEAPAWAPVDTVRVLGPGGEELARLDARQGGPVALETQVEVPARRFLVVEAWSEASSPLTGAQPWAVTSAIWLP